jgi:MFS family permease
MPRRTREPGALRAFGTQNYRRYFTGELVSLCGGWVQSIAQAWFVLQLGGTGLELGVVISLQNLPPLLLAPYGGTIADRFDNRRLLILMQGFGIVQALGLAILTSAGVMTVNWIYLFSILLGVINSFQFPAMNAFLYELVPEDSLSSAIGLGSVTMSVGRLVGPAIAGILLATLGVAACFYANAATFVLFIVMLLLVRPGELRSRRASDRASVTLLDGLLYAWRRPVLRLTLVAIAIVSMLAYNFSLVIPAMTSFEFHASSTGYAWVAGAAGAAALIGGFAVAAVARPTVRMFGWAGVGFGAPVLVSAFVPTIGLFALLWFGVGLASTVFMALGQMVLQHGTDAEYQGRVMSLYTMAWMGTTLFGAIAMGALVDAGSARAAVAVSGIATLVVAAVVLVWAARQTTMGRLAKPRTLLE